MIFRHLLDTDHGDDSHVDTDLRPRVESPLQGPQRPCPHLAAESGLQRDGPSSMYEEPC